MWNSTFFSPCKYQMRKEAEKIMVPAVVAPTKAEQDATLKSREEIIQPE